MKVFIDTADIKQIKKAFSWGIVSGITTNPSLIEKASKDLKGDLKTHIKNILKTAKNNPVSLEVTGLDEESMFNQSLALYERFKKFGNVVIKIPVNPAREKGKTDFDGLKVIKRLSEKNIPVNCTVIMSPEQALLASIAGATYVSPFAGRIDDELRSKLDEHHPLKKSRYYPMDGIRINKETIYHDSGIISGVDLVWKTVEILRPLDTQVLAASIRTKEQARECALVGADISTIPFDVLNEMIAHKKSYEAIKKFSESASNIPEYEKLLK